MKEEGLKDESELQSYMIVRIEKYLNDKGREIIGWDEILDGGLAPNATVMSWRGTEGGIAAARMGRPASMILKNNSISDRDIILKLQEASCAGVRIDMIVRGISGVWRLHPHRTDLLLRPGSRFIGK